MMEALNKLYLHESALWETDYDPEGFYWMDCTDREHSVISFVRQSQDRQSLLLVVLNLAPIPRTAYRIGLPEPGRWKEALNSDAGCYGGSNQGNLGSVEAEEFRMHNQPHSAAFTLPPMSLLMFKHERV